MARYDSNLEATHEVSLSDVFRDAVSAPNERLRQEAIACYLSAGDGWRDAITLLRGAFAAEGERGSSGLTSGKAD